MPPSSTRCEPSSRTQGLCGQRGDDAARADNRCWKKDRVAHLFCLAFARGRALSRGLIASRVRLSGARAFRSIRVDMCRPAKFHVWIRAVRTRQSQRLLAQMSQDRRSIAVFRKCRSVDRFADRNGDRSAHQPARLVENHGNAQGIVNMTEDLEKARVLATEMDRDCPDTRYPRQLGGERMPDAIECWS